MGHLRVCTIAVVAIVSILICTTNGQSGRRNRMGTHHHDVHEHHQHVHHDDHDNHGHDVDDNHDAHHHDDHGAHHHEDHDAHHRNGHEHHHSSDHNHTTWTCPTGWVSYSDGANISCLFFGTETISQDNLYRTCTGYNAKPVVILSAEKNAFIAEKVTETGFNYLLGLLKYSGYERRFRWWNHLEAESYFLPDTVQEQQDYYQRSCVYIVGFRLGTWEVNSCDDPQRYICERSPECTPGLFGPSCSDVCHCMGEPCDTSSGHSDCRFGCERGYTGPSCSKVREYPEVRYFCVSGAEEHVGKHVDIFINTKGVNYRSIYPTLGNGTEKGSWCEGTTVSGPDYKFNHVAITIPVNDTVTEEIREGRCAAREVSEGLMQWSVAIQEYPDIVLDTDLQVLITCNFSASESMQRSSGVNQHIHDHQTPDRKVEISPDTADVTLDVVNPYSLQPITEAHIGDPVKLSIKYGYQQGSMIKGVCPHHCEATTPDGTLVKQLIDAHGCSKSDSPVREFSYENSTTTTIISTPWFPLFAFDEHDRVQFKCSFDICVHAAERHCEPGCRLGYYVNHHRHRRDVSRDLERENIEWTSGVIRILPDRSYEEGDKLDHQNTLHRVQPKEEHPESEQANSDVTTSPRTTPQPLEVKVNLADLLTPMTLALFLIFFVAFLSVFLIIHQVLNKGISRLRHDFGLSQFRDKIIYAKLDGPFGKDGKTSA